MMIDSVGVIRRGWQEVAATVAPHVTGLADLLEKRLGEAQQLGTLDEASLLAIVDAATQLAANSGFVEVAPALSKRLRRHLYEYLLSLDAAGDSRPAPALAETAVPEAGGPLIGADEVAALAGDHPGGGDAGPRGASVGSEPASAELPALPEAADEADSASPSPAFQPASDAGTEEPVSSAPRFNFHIGDPDDMLAASPPPSESESNGSHGALPELFAPLDLQALGDPAPPRRTSFGDPSTWPKPITPQLKGGRGRGGSPTRSSDAADAAGGDPPMAAETSTAASPGRLDPAPAPPEPRASAVLGVVAPDASPAANADPPPIPSIELASVGDPVTEKDLAQLRAAVEERLRKKRCDEAAALLQRAAHDLGGQGVAAIALQAGDRCRSLGKRNAALNCYLAASRADPVFEAPLARLADICIDDHDIDLAVSYLERIARLTRLRGDQRGALRIYRKIATIAPYRDDVLEMLMHAETSGRID